MQELETLFETFVEGVLERNYAVIDDFLPAPLVTSLRHNLLHRKAEGLMHPAGIGKHFTYQKNLRVRGDLISWIDEHPADPSEVAFIQRVEQLIQYLNRTCFTALNGFEFHYAFYDEGSFYKRHLDQFQHDRGRKFTLVTYLNEDWKEADGGQLVLYLPEGTQEVLPLGGRAVFFKADEIEHEVRMAHRPRFSIAGWLLSR